jgi:hypothetical protein
VLGQATEARYIPVFQLRLGLLITAQSGAHAGQDEEAGESRPTGLEKAGRSSLKQRDTNSCIVCPWVNGSDKAPEKTMWGLKKLRKFTEGDPLIIRVWPSKFSISITRRRGLSLKP